VSFLQETTFDAQGEARFATYPEPMNNPAAQPELAA